MHSIPVLDALRDRYVLERELGRGGMATVYLARDLKHGRMVALKVMRPEIALALGPERFLHEIRISSRLDHPHILTLIDSGKNEGYLWYVLPYVRGESLRGKLEREKQLSVEETIRIATQVAAALDFAHRQGIIHRDIKPENILLHEGEAVVTDFGIALAVREAGGERLTGTGMSLGTPQYMSPEQATGDRELDARTDVYALAAVVYEMLAGEPPFTGPTVQSIIAKQLTDRPLGLGVTRQDLPPNIDAAVRRGLAKVPADRFAGTAEFATALTTPTGQAGPTVRRRKRAAIGLALATIIVAVAAILVMPEKEQAVASAPGGTDVASVAVLPFDNLTGNPADDYLSDGMTEEVIGQLAQVPGLKVISRTSTEALKGTGLTLRQIADTLDVQHILEGSVRHAANRVRVMVDLIDARTDGHVWSSRFDGDLTDVFAVQEEIARNVADSLVSAVGGRMLSSRIRSHDPAAYAAFLEGRTQLYRRTREGLRGAVTLFQQAIDQDSTYAPAYSALASAYYLLVSYQYGGVDYMSAYTRGLELANRAIALDPDLGEAYAVRGLILTRSWAPAASIARDFDRALELVPNSADVHQWRAHFLAREGRFAEGFAEAERAVALDPLSPGVRLTLALSGVNVKRYSRAIAEADRINALEPTLARPRMIRSVAELLSGQPEQCASRSIPPYLVMRALCLHAMGRTEEATRLVDSVRTLIASGRPADSTFVINLAIQGIAQYYAWIGDSKQALAWLERAYAITPEGEDFRMLATGLYDKVRNDPGFQAGLTRIRTEIHGRIGGSTAVERR